MMKRAWSSAALAAAIVAAACGRDGTERAGPPVETRPDPAARAESTGGYRPPSLRLSPAGGPAGSQVTISLSGLVIRAPHEVGFGDMSEHIILAQAESDATGDFSTTVTVPADATPSTHYFFLADASTGQMVSTPTAFLVTTAEGGVTLSGRMSDEGVECTAMRGDTGELYTLSGMDDFPEPGTQVIVQGTLAEMSICQQGLTIAVESIEAVR